MVMDMKLLQRQADELDRLVPELPPSTLPTACAAERDLLALADREGASGCQALLEVLAAAGEEVEDCSICGEPGKVVIDREAQDSEAVALRVVLVCRLQFLDKTLLATKCQFACGLCRQLRNTGSLLQELASGRADEECDTAEGLLEHLAVVNELPEVAENADACHMWGQELLSRAYALQIVASMHGWQLINPDGSPFQAGKPGAAAALALQLMLPEATAEEQQKILASALGAVPQKAEQPAEDVSRKPKKPGKNSGKKAATVVPNTTAQQQMVAQTATFNKERRKQRRRSVSEASQGDGKARKKQRSEQ